MMLSISLSHLKKIRESLFCLHVSELRQIAELLVLSPKGKKGEVIQRIVHFLSTGEEIPIPKFPEISCAKRVRQYPISSMELMLKGAYKNDHKTRWFFKEQIGPHFHFTAFGIDWLNERWMTGKPPTYGEFAKMWEREFLRRKNNPNSPKDEWAYIRFTQKYLRQFPKASQRAMIDAWEEERAVRKKQVFEIFSQVLHDYSSESHSQII